MKNKLKLAVAPAVTDIACCTLNLDKDEKNQRDVISHYCFIVYIQRTANDAENMKSSCSPLHGERQIFSFCWSPAIPILGQQNQSSSWNTWTLSTSDSSTSTCCALPVLTAAFAQPGWNLLCLQSFL